MQRFNFDIFEKVIYLRCGLDEKRCDELSHFMVEYLEDLIVNEANKQKFKHQGKVRGDSYSLAECKGEIAQASAEFLKLELNPELGFLIGLMTANALANGNVIVRKLIETGRLPEPSQE